MSNKTGWQSCREFIVYWEGSPTGFGRYLHTYQSITGTYLIPALRYPYVLAFERPSLKFVTLRQVPWRPAVDNNQPQWPLLILIVHAHLGLNDTKNLFLAPIPTACELFDIGAE